MWHDLVRNGGCRCACTRRHTCMPARIRSGTRTLTHALARVHAQMHKATDRPTNRPTERPNDRPIDRQTDRQAGRQADRQTGRQTDRRTDGTWLYGCRFGGAASVSARMARGSTSTGTRTSNLDQCHNYITIEAHNCRGNAFMPYLYRS